MLERSEQTICAISTPHGSGGIAVIRVSGPDSLKYCKKISPVLHSKKSIESHRAYFSDLLDFDGNKVDEVIFTYFMEGKSFTGEETVEISCHGSSFITQQILDLLIKSGCRIAERGEFTFRAFMNGRLDLIQAESVLALIESQNKASARMALRQLDGHVSEAFEIIISELTWCLAHIEASIDFIEQGIQVVENKTLIEKLTAILNTLKKLITSYESGRLIRDGARIVLVGEPNVGKSSLLNLIAQTDRAIVTPIAGTTRDTIESTVVYSGHKFNFVDTAGLRESEDHVELIGIDKSKKEASKADLLCFVLDCSQKNFVRSLAYAAQHPTTNKLFILNKADMITDGERASVLNNLPTNSVGFFTSALNKDSRDGLLEAISGAIGSFDYLDDAVISSSRQYEQATEAFEMISKSIAELNKNMGAEFVAMYLKESLISLQKILGQVYDDQIMDKVFKEFCLGK